MHSAQKAKAMEDGWLTMHPAIKSPYFGRLNAFKPGRTIDFSLTFDSFVPLASLIIRSYT